MIHYTIDHLAYILRNLSFYCTFMYFLPQFCYNYYIIFSLIDGARPLEESSSYIMYFMTSLVYLSADYFAKQILNEAEVTYNLPGLILRITEKFHRTVVAQNVLYSSPV